MGDHPFLGLALSVPDASLVLYRPIPANKWSADLKW